LKCDFLFYEEKNIHLNVFLIIFTQIYKNKYMKNNALFSLLFAMLFWQVGIANFQDSYIKHTITDGETIPDIAKKYKVTPFDIYKLNPDLQNGVELNTVLLIPPSNVSISKEEVAIIKSETAKMLASKTNTSRIQNPTKHTVQPKETLYGISKMYNITIEELQNANAELLKDGLKIGQILTIPSSNGATKNITTIAAETPKPSPKPTQRTTEEKSTNGFHIIQPKETKYGISKKYGMTIEELELLNPQIATAFNIGMKLKVSGNAVQEITETPKSVEPLNQAIKNSDSSSGKKYLQEYVIKPNETIASLATMFGITQAELLQLNPELKKGVKQGMIIRVPIGSKMAMPKKEQGNLFKTINTNARKQLALLLPFNVNRIENDTVVTLQEKLKKDKFLNLTLDFYAGALMAIDSAKVLGMNIDVLILDSQETKNSSFVAGLVAENKLQKMDAIIGPFYQVNVEKLADLVSPSNTPVISPLSKDIGKRFSNLYQATPTTELLRSSVFDYMNDRNGNIIAIVDPKKASIKQYINQQENVKIVGLSPKNTVVMDSIKTHLSKDRLNYVLLATENTGMVLGATSSLINLQKEYPIQMVVLEQNETLDFEEIPLSRLTKLKLLYPSITRPNETPEAKQFDAKYKRINKVSPSMYSIRGFDVTFDTMLRLSQPISFEENAHASSSEQIENKFEYIQNNSLGYDNQAVYMLYYDTDLTIKLAQ
jgi:LysM repeat protein